MSAASICIGTILRHPKHRSRAAWPRKMLLGDLGDILADLEERVTALESEDRADLSELKCAVRDLEGRLDSI